jgi:DNA polymerase III subunit gamma/tau
MSYQVLARKWRPQRFEDVIGQQAVTRTLRNALRSRRLAQAFVFAGPRGCGKTTSARILARALNCVKGPTPDPCGECEACVEIAEGRDIDVLEIDAATHTGVDNVREVIIEGLSIAPVRNRYKVFIIDEVHMLSASSFNALLKSIEEPPPHVVFMMATTELHKIPDTVLSRAQVHEFRTISAKTVADRLRFIANEEQIAVPDDALLLLARAGEGSMRDSLSAFDQVRAFAGDQITTEDVVTVLGLVGRDLVFDMLEAVVAEDAPAAFALTERAIERGYDLRLLCRELARATRDLLVLSVDKSRASDPDVVGDSDRERLLLLVDRWSREDLLRGFDLLTRTEQEIRASDQPRYNLEMALLRLMHLRKLVPLTDLLTGATGARGAAGAAGARGAAGAARATSAASGPGGSRMPVTAPTRTTGAAGATGVAGATGATGATGAPYRDAFLAEVKAAKPTFYNLVVAQAFSIDANASSVTFAFQPNQKVPKAQCEDNRAWVQGIVEKVTGQKLPVNIVFTDAASAAPAPPPPAAAPAPVSGERKAAALEHETVRHLLEVFPVEKTTVQEE